MKKVLFILAFLAIGMIATAQTQTIYNQLKLATVNDGTVSDSLVLVQGTDKIIRKIPLSSISGSTEIPSLQEVTNNGNVTSHPIYAKEFRVDTSPDSLMVLNNRYFTLGDVGSDYNGNWRKYFSVFDPNDYPQGFEFYSQDTVTNGVLVVYGDVNRGNSNFNVYSGGNGGSASFNVNSYYNNSWFTTKGLELGSSGASSAYLRLDAANNELNIQSNNIRFRNSLISPYVELETSSVTSNRVLNAPDESGTIATREWVTANSGGGSEPKTLIAHVNYNGTAANLTVVKNTFDDVPAFNIMKLSTGYYLLYYTGDGSYFSSSSNTFITITPRMQKGFTPNIQWSFGSNTREMEIRCFDLRTSSSTTSDCGFGGGGLRMFEIKIEYYQ